MALHRLPDDHPDQPDQSKEPTMPAPRFLILGREPALILGTIAATIQLASATLLPLTTEQQGVLNAVAIAVIGLLTAAAVSAEKAAPAVLGLAQAVLACALAFGLALTPEVQGAVMAFTAAIVSAFVRTQVGAPTAAVAA